MKKILFAVFICGLAASCNNAETTDETETTSPVEQQSTPAETGTYTDTLAAPADTMQGVDTTMAQ